MRWVPGLKSFKLIDFNEICGFVGGFWGFVFGLGGLFWGFVFWAWGGCFGGLCFGVGGGLA